MCHVSKRDYVSKIPEPRRHAQGDNLLRPVDAWSHSHALLYSLQQQACPFIQTGTIGGVTVHYVVENEKPTKKFIQLKRLSGEFTFVDSLGTDAQSLYVPILGLEKSTLAFPIL